MFQRRLNENGVDITTNKTRLKLRIRDHFSGKCHEQSDGKNILIILNEGMKIILKDASLFCYYKFEAVTIALVVKILRREILSWKPLPFNGQFQPYCQSKS